MKESKINKEINGAIKSEEQYRIILNSLNDPMHVVDKDLKITFQNPAMVLWLNKLNIISDLVGKTLFEAFPFLEYDKIHNEYNKVFKTGEILITIEATKLTNGIIFTETLKIPVKSNGKVEQVLTIMRDITAQKKAEEKLKASEEKYKNIISNLMDIIIILDLKGNFLYVSPQIYDISGFKQKEIIGKNGFKLMHPDDINKAASVLKEAIEQKKKIYIEYRTIHKQGHYIDVSTSGRIVNIEGEDRIFAVVRDISEHKISEQKLKESEEKYRLITENANDMIAILNEKMEYEYVNEAAFLNIMGRTKNELIGYNSLRWAHPDDIEKSINAFKEGWEKGEAFIQARFRDTQEKYHSLEIRGKLITDHKGEKKVLIVSRDISERKEAEHKLKDSKEKYRYLIENSIEGVWVIDSEAKTILVNPSMAHILGYTVEEMMGKSLFSFTDEEQVKITKYHLEKRKKGISEERGAYFLHKNGNKVYLRIKATPIFDSEGNYEGTYAFLADITQKMLAEQKLKESEERFRTLFEIAPASISVLDLDGNIILSNQKFCNLHGVKNSELLEGRKILEFIAEKDWSKLKEAMKKSFEGLPRGLNQYTMLKDNGTEFPAEAISSGIKNKKGEIIGLIGVAQDITERNIVEQKLKESEEKYSHLFLSSPYSIIIANMNGKVIDCNFLEDKITGYLKEEIIGKNMLDIPMFPKEYLPVVIKDFKTLLKGRIPKPNEIQIRKKDGTLVWVQPTASIFKIEGESYIQIIMQEITERKNSEEKLKESEEKFRTIAEQSFLGIAILQNDIVSYVNEQLAYKFGYTIEEIMKWGVGGFMKVIYPDDRKMVAEQAKKKQSGEPDAVNQYQFRGIKKNGNITWLEIFSKTINYKGKPADFITIHDITEEKLAGQKLKESEENFRTIAEQAFMGTLIIQNDQVAYMNNALLQIFDFSQEEVNYWKKDDLLKLIHPEDLQYLREHRQRIRDGESDIKPYYSYRVFTKYGKIKWIDQFSRPIVYRGNPAEIVTIMDITEKKKAEQELVKLNSLKSELLRRTSHELKTPLVSIKGFSDLLLTVHKEKLDDYVLATIHEIRLGCERLESLIHDILKTSELEAESVELKKSEEDLSFLIKLCIKEFQGLTRLRNHEVSTDIHDKLITNFEPEQIHLVISNLLNNAIKYTPPNGKIEVKSAITDNSILISIHDNGIGITNEEKKRLFSQFGKIERYGQGFDIISDGSGLGLFISKKIVELHGGKIGVKSKGRNKGSTFYFTLPLTNEK